MSTTIRTRSGATRVLPEHVDPAIVVGLDHEGRIVVDQFDAFNAADPAPAQPGGYVSRPFLFGLTLCCDGWDKGMEDGVYCRASYGGAPNADEGNYLFRWPDGFGEAFDPRVDLESVRPGHTAESVR